jgi:predicted enzyme related to lactoylglutathione lyase
MKSACNVVMVVCMCVLWSWGAQSAPAFAPACVAEKHRALDFWVGEWDVIWSTADGRKGLASSSVVRENGGCVIREHFRDLAGGLEGTGLYSYFAAIDAWTLAWMDNQGVTISSSGGQSSEGRERFQMRLRRGADPNKQYRTVWEDVTPGAFTWRFQTRDNDIESWTDEGVSRYRRKQTQEEAALRVFRILMPVPDIDAAATFYGALFGNPGERVSPGRHYFVAGEVVFACYSPNADGDHKQIPPLRTETYLAVHDLEDAFKRAVAAGAKPSTETQGHAGNLGRIEMRPWGERSVYVTDPFGNPLSLVDERTVFTGSGLPAGKS